LRQLHLLIPAPNAWPSKPKHLNGRFLRRAGAGCGAAFPEALQVFSASATSESFLKPVERCAFASRFVLEIGRQQMNDITPRVKFAIHLSHRGKVRHIHQSAELLSKSRGFGHAHLSELHRQICSTEQAVFCALNLSRFRSTFRKISLRDCFLPSHIT
jgi:hypothetical protein